MKEEIDPNSAKGHFLARMSHEMRTPLNAIIGMCTIAQSSPEKSAECLTRINEASTYLLGTINSILDAAKIDAGKMKLSYAEFDLDGMIQKTAAAQKFMLNAKNQNLVLELDPSLPKIIVGDEQRLAQVLDNFLSNAVKFTPPGGTITLKVLTLKEDEKTCSLRFCVIDTGIGISTKGLKTIFSLFEQIDGGLTRKSGGAGMGLTISAGIVHLMGGEIQVRSEPGKGSRFFFEITVDRKPGKAPVDDSPAGFDAETDSSPQNKFEGISIILAEDVEINREIVLSLLEGSGLLIDCAENGLEALEMYRADSSKYRLILMDIHMPEMDGLEAAQRIRAFEAELGPYGGKPHEIPIIAMTANVYRDDVDKYLAAGMSGHLGKPIDYDELMKQLRHFLL